MFTTIDGLLKVVQRMIMWISVLCIIVGMSLSFIVQKNMLGTWFVFSGTSFFSAGWLLVWFLYKFVQCCPVVCPHCKKTDQVILGAQKYICSQCTRLVHVKSHKSGSKKVMLTLISSQNKSINFKEKRKNLNLYA